MGKKGQETKNVIIITEFDSLGGNFERSYLLNNLEKGGILFSPAQTKRALDKIEQVNSGGVKEFWADVYNINASSTDLDKVIRF